MTETKLGRQTKGDQRDVDLVVAAQDGNQQALLEILARDEVLIIEQPGPGTIADKGAKATRVEIIRR